MSKYHADTENSNELHFRNNSNEIILFYFFFCESIACDYIGFEVSLWSPYGIGRSYIFSCCGLFFFFFLLLSFFSSPNLSRRRLDVCHTSTHGVALAGIQNACLKCAARGSLKIQDANSRQKFATWAPSHNFVGLYLCKLRHVSTIGKKTC